MASGLGKRFGGNKLMAEIKGKPMISYILDASEGLFFKRVVVTRSHAVEEFCTERGIDCIIHEMPFRSDTVRLGLEWMGEDISACCFASADQPMLSKNSLEELICSSCEKPEFIYRLSFKGTPGNPILFPGKLFEDLKNLPEGKGGGYVANGNPDLVRFVEAADEMELFDIDTKEDLEKCK